MHLHIILRHKCNKITATQSNHKTNSQTCLLFPPTNKTMYHKFNKLWDINLKFNKLWDFKKTHQQTVRHLQTYLWRISNSFVSLLILTLPASLAGTRKQCYFLIEQSLYY